MQIIALFLRIILSRDDTKYSLMNEVVLISAIVVYGLFIIFGTKWVFEFMMAQNMKENVAIYYNRKILHMFCGGLIGAMAPSILDEPIYALYIGILFTIITYILNIFIPYPNIMSWIIKRRRWIKYSIFI